MVIGGIVAGLVINVSEFVLNTLVLGPEMAQEPWPFPATNRTAGGFAERQAQGAACISRDLESPPLM